MGYNRSSKAHLTQSSNLELDRESRFLVSWLPSLIVDTESNADNVVINQHAPQNQKAGFPPGVSVVDS